MLTLYDYLDSGNGYKCRLILALLNTPYTRVELDLDKGETRTPQFLARNPNGRIPALELEDGTVLPESNAILYYLADGTAYLPTERLARAQVMQWLFFEQYSHEPYVATPRWIIRHLGRDHPRMTEMPERLEKGRAAFAVMEQHLQRHDYFVGQRYSIADIALYAYTHRAHEGDHDLSPWPALRAWLDRVATQPGHIKMLPGD
ncbi:glutathione S-transferase family protein [Ferrovibrio terrae]|uniref:Glutathione S-transferase family protein n=1 Tax=Ferrovibrio terrae TaxID=2594003 RepID=A0A516H7C4_9PROT|nr:glutathione S-transferase family protein [Ferrovibrio terrae]QDO99621.1 glutathione S-transferase family protein [Ferrovibrio terrae]